MKRTLFFIGFVAVAVSHSELVPAQAATTQDAAKPADKPAEPAAPSTGSPAPAAPATPTTPPAQATASAPVTAPATPPATPAQPPVQEPKVEEKVEEQKTEQESAENPAQEVAPATPAPTAPAQPAGPTTEPQISAGAPAATGTNGTAASTPSEDAPAEEKTGTQEQPQPTPAPEKPEAEKPASDKKEAAAKEEPAKPANGEVLDTIDIEEGGNWLIKRQIFEDTFKLMDQMDEVNTSIRDMRLTFFKSRNEIDKKVALFIKDIGYNLGKLDEIASTILKRMEQERNKEGDLSEEERSVVSSVENLEEKILHIQEMVQEIMRLDDKIDSEILKSLEDRINESARYRQEGWKNLQSIKKILSDEKAQNLYDKSKALYDAMKEVLSWQQSKLLPYFTETIQTIEHDMETIKTDLQELQSKGVDLQQEVEKIELQENMADKEKEREEVDQAVKEATLKQKGVLNSVKNFFGAILDYVQNFFGWIASFFTGS
jgi:hypothetical protein